MPGAGVVAVSIFVNPLQFGAAEDLVALSAHPGDGPRRSAATKVSSWSSLPAVDDMYPAGAATTTVDPGPLGAQLEGAVAARPLRRRADRRREAAPHRRPDVAFFGEKDYQQLVLVPKMVADLNFPLDVVGVPTVREPDGLAMSSRNALPLTRAARARRDPAAGAARRCAGVGARSGAVLTTARAVLDAEPAIAVDYLELRDPELGPAPRPAARGCSSPPGWAPPA